MKIEHLYKSFNSLQVFKDFSIELKEGEITSILGPSGCGKTTLLNIISGITPPDSAVFTGFEGKRISYIFQEPRLLPWKTVRSNIEFVLDNSHSRDEKHFKCNLLMERVGLSKFADYYPQQLSGGMKQRVAIARAFAIPSDIILMDEPTSGLDSDMKMNIISWFKTIWKEDPRTAVYVTHDESEARILSNRIILLQPFK